MDGLKVHRTVVTNPFDPAGSSRTSWFDWGPGVSVRRIMPANMRRHDPEFIRVRRNGVDVDQADWDKQLQPGDFVSIESTPGAPLAFLIPHLIAAAISAAVSFIAAKLFAPPDEGAAKPEDNESPTYAWSGVRANYAANGAPIPVIYGEHRVGGLVIGQYVESFVSTNTSNVITGGRSTLRLLILLGHGPIHSVGGVTVDSNGLQGDNLPDGVQIDGNNAKNYSGVRMWVRLGSLDQAYIPSFVSTKSLNFVGLLMDNVHDPSGQATPQTNWEFGVAYDMTVDADEVELDFQFPFGLYELSGATLQQQTVGFQVRYVELDGGGSPTGPYVIPSQFDDGSANPSFVTGKTQGEFVVTRRLAFQNPASYVPATAGDLFLAGKGEGYFERADLDGSTVGWQLDDTFKPLTIEIFYSYKQGSAAGNGSGSSRAIFGFINSSETVNSSGSYNITQPTTGTLKGIAIKWTDNDFSSTADDVGIEIEMGEGTDGGTNNRGLSNGWQRLIIPSLFQVANGNEKFGQLALKFDWSNGEARLAVIHDGQRVFFTENKLDIQSAANSTDLTRVRVSAQPLRLGSSNKMGSFSSGSGFDQVRIWKRWVSDSALNASWNNGAPQGNTGVGSNLVARWGMNVANSSGLGPGPSLYNAGTFNDQSGNGLPLGIVDTGGGGVQKKVGWVLDGSEVAVRKKAKYRIEAQRMDVVRDSTTIKDLIYFHRVTTVIDHALTYPGRALVALSIPAQGQLNTNTPNVTFLVKGKLVPIWDGGSTANPNAPPAWSANPYWCALDWITEEYGLGRQFGLRSVDLESVQDGATYSDQRVSALKAPFTVKRVRHINIGGVDYMYITATFVANGESLPSHFAVGNVVKLTGTVSAGAPSWASTIVGGGPYGIGAVGILTIFDDDTIRVAWPSTLVSPPPSPTSWDPDTDVPPSTISCEVYEARLECHGVLDRGGIKAWDNLMKILSAGRAAPVKLGSRIRLKCEKATSVSQMFNSSNIQEDTFKLSAKTAEEEFNVATADILDRDRNYERSPVELQHSSLQDVTNAVKVRRKSFTMEMNTRPSQALRELRILLNAAHLLRVTASFDTGLDAAFVEAGDVVGVTHDLPLWAFGGRCRSISPNRKSIVIDRQVVLAPAVTYYAGVRNGSTDAVEVQQVTSAAGTYEPGDLIDVVANYSAKPQPEDLWAIGQATTAHKEFRTIETTLTRQLWRSMGLVEYNPSIFDEGTFPELPAPITELTEPASGGTPAQPLTVTAADGSGVDPASGAFSLRINASWVHEKRTRALVNRTVVWISQEPEDGSLERVWDVAATVQGGESRVSFEHPSLVVGKAYRVKAQPIGHDGSSYSIEMMGGFAVRVWGRSTGLPAPTSVTIAQTGRVVAYSVEQPDGGRQASPEFRRGGWVLGHHMLSLGAGSAESVQDENWVAVPTSNAGKSHPKICVRNRFLSGQASTADTPALTPLLGGFETPLAEGSIEDLGWTAGSPAPVLTGFVVHADGYIEFDGVAINGIYDTTEVSLSEARLVHVSLGIEAEQVHPRTWGAYEGTTGGAHFGDGPLASSAPSPGPFPDGNRWAGGGSPQGGFEDAWGSAFSESWAWEGPTDDLHHDIERRDNGNVVLRLNIAYGVGSVGQFETYRPGWYYGDTFKFRLRLIRRNTGYQARLHRMAYSLRVAKEDLIDGGTT